MIGILGGARRGRRETDAAEGHLVNDASEDLVAVLRSISAPVFLLGHSYEARVSLEAAAVVPN